MLLLLGFFLVTINSFRRAHAPALNGRKVIFLGPGCAHVAYTMGFLDALLADTAIRKAIISANATFGGVSSGAQAAGFAMAVLQGVLEMREWYHRLMRPGYELLKTRTTLAMGEEMERARYEISRIDEEHGSQMTFFHEIPISFTDLTLRPVFVCQFASLEDFSRAVGASSYVPFFMGLKPWYWLPDVGKRVFDGYLGLWRSRFPSNYMYISFLPTIPRFVIGVKHFLPAYKYDTTSNSLFVKAWPWADPDWADASYERGRRDFCAAGAELQNKFLDFLSS